MSDPTTPTMSEYTDLTGVPMSIIHCTPAQWAAYEAELSELGYDLYGDFKYQQSTDYPGYIMAIGEKVNLEELAWLDEKGFTVISDAFRFSNQPSAFM